MADHCVARSGPQRQQENKRNLTPTIHSVYLKAIGPGVVSWREKGTKPGAAFGASLWARALLDRNERNLLVKLRCNNCSQGQKVYMRVRETGQSESVLQ